jgi:uncharacterized protein
MSPDFLEAVLDWMQSIVCETGQKNINLTFHGGEPLVAGYELWRFALNGLASRFKGISLKIGLQSNLHLLDDDYCDLFLEYGVEVGTSLDGPYEINDAQRGDGYFDRTMAGVQLARSRGLSIGCIATFTSASAKFWREVLNFFITERLNFSIHAAVPSLGQTVTPFVLSADTYASLLVEALDDYVKLRREIRISSLDQIIRCVVNNRGDVCTFQDCCGMFLVVDPHGDIYPCQRLSGRQEFRLGQVAEHPTFSFLMNSQAAIRFHEREQRVREVCGNCPHFERCRGGCPYNAWTASGYDPIRDPYCSAYKAIFNSIDDRLRAEMASEENLAAMTDHPWSGRGHPVLRKGPLIDLAREGAHPSEIARTARRIVAAVEYARGPNPSDVIERLVAKGICRSRETAEVSLNGLYHSLHPQQVRLNNLYLHLTFRCNFICKHCYARANATRQDRGEMSTSAVERLIVDARSAGFRQVVLTGGEPTIHTSRDEWLSRLALIRLNVAPMNLVLRTNLAIPMDDEALRRIAQAFDQVVVSVDGNERTHDDRRGPGAYAATLLNLERYLALASEIPKSGELSLSAVLRRVDIEGEPGKSVRELACRLGVRRTRFRPILPLGRALDWPEPPTSEALGTYADPLDLIEKGFRPAVSCGLGHNLYVEPSGESFPCYVYHEPHSHLGNVVTNGLQSVLADEKFRDLARHHVDTNLKCRLCHWRYICGGACRAWDDEVTRRDLDAPPSECEGLKEQSKILYEAALHWLGKDE